ncbi:hypothetical protein [Streptomyces peucetius]|uniref:Uncharacterized protein n=1 Tax=Streptomyces peucetius TaxID=1950 RepID=A0ABY6IF13_STRPE|nr:hypothetical protein [Streptomyces peucetius]UYQ65568.1 hypothetical protein OGH68_31620 [Streptomyces peucetius]
MENSTLPTAVVAALTDLDSLRDRLTDLLNLLGGWHAAGQRNPFENRMIGQLYQCLRHGRRFDEDVALPPASVLVVAGWPACGVGGWTTHGAKR